MLLWKIVKFRPPKIMLPEVLKSVPYQNGALQFQQMPAGISFNVSRSLAAHETIYNRTN